MNIYLESALEGKFKTLPIQPAGHRYKVMVSNENQDLIQLCGLDHWAFDSCGIVSLFSFARYNPAQNWWKEKENTEAFVKFLTNLKFPCDNWIPNEYIFALAGFQFKSNDKFSPAYMNHLVKHPKVRRLDRFTNKAHGPAHIYMFRLSINKDFSYLDKGVKGED